MGRSMATNESSTRVRHTILIGLALLLCALAFFQWQPTNVEVRVPGHTHPDSLSFVINSGERLEFALDSTGRRSEYVVDIQYSGHAIFYRNGELISPNKCAHAASFSLCHLRIQLEGGHGVLIVESGDAKPLQIQSHDVRLIRSKVMTALADAPYGLLFPLLIAVVVVNAIFFRRRRFSEWLIGLAGLAIIALLQPWFAVVLTAFLWALYHLNVRTSLSHSTRAVVGVMLFSVLTLILFKYLLDDLFLLFAQPGELNLLFPIGLSYFLIRIIDTQLKWHRNELQGLTFRELLAFVVFPATIPAGPIHTIDGFGRSRLTSIEIGDWARGLSRISIGLFKKLAIANLLLFPMLFADQGLMTRVLVDPFTAQSATILAALLLCYAYVYVDFSAYSDIAIGFSRLLGYRMVENFDWPIVRPNIKQFWSHWHMSLSGWCMRNIYFPLMIKLKDFTLPTYSVMIVVGLWHSLTLPWLLWGLHHASGIAFVSWRQERRRKRTRANRQPAHTRHSYQTFLGVGSGIIFTGFFVSAGQAFVQVGDIETALALYLRFWAAPLDLLQNIR